MDGSSKAALAKAIAGFPDAKLTTEAEFAKSRADGLKMILKMLYVLLGFSVVVSLFGMVNTLVLAVYERTRELGMLRAVGMTRRQARRMIRHESIITALIGAAMGIPLGIFLAALITQALSKYGVGLSLPVTELVAFTVVAIVAGVLAAIIPARRASKIDVLTRCSTSRRAGRGGDEGRPGRLLAYGLVVLRVKVSVFVYAPVRSASLALMQLAEVSVDRSLETGPLGQQVQRRGRSRRCCRRCRCWRRCGRGPAAAPAARTCR